MFPTPRRTPMTQATIRQACAHPALAQVIEDQGHRLIGGPGFDPHPQLYPSAAAEIWSDFSIRWARVMRAPTPGQTRDWVRAARRRRFDAGPSAW